jgi:glycosyltransferase involved in cell wall biosynthesis
LGNICYIQTIDYKHNDLHNLWIKRLPPEKSCLKYLCPMLILLDCRPLLVHGPDSERSQVIFSAAAALSRDRAVKWLFLVDSSYRPGLIPSIAGSSVLIHRALPGRIGWRVWYDWLIPRLAKKHKADWIMLTGGITAASPMMGTKKGGTMRAIPQCLWMPEKANPAEGRDYLPLYRGRLRDSLFRASLLFCFSAADRSWLAGQTEGPDPNKFVVVPTWPSEGVAPLSLAEKEEVKRQYAAGKEYFLADVTSADEEGITQLLKSFSLFKKRQLSNLQLILAGRKPLPESEFNHRLETYKYRQDIHWCEAPEAKRQLTGAAYAFLFPFEKKTLGIPVLNAWKAEVPVIIGKDCGLPDWAGDGVLVADRADPASLAGHLMAIYKDELLRADLIEKGRSRVAAFSPQRSMAEIGAALTRTSRQSISG